MLADEQIEKLRLTLQTGGWRDVVVPVLQARLARLKDLAFMLPSERPEPYGKMDDLAASYVLRGEIRNCEWVLDAFQNEVTVHDLNRRRDELARDGRAEPANPGRGA